MLVADYAEVADAYKQQKPTYDQLAALAEGLLKDHLSAAGIYASVEGRAKEVDSFATKALLGDRYADPLQEIGDKAGLRVIVPYLRDVDVVESSVRELFTVIQREQKLDALAYNEIGYLGVHLDCRLTEDQGRESDPKFAGLRFELQIRTAAQGAWAQVAHEQLYKPPSEVPLALKRRIYRLVSLVELFDNEVEEFLVESQKTPGYSEAFALAPLADLLLQQFDVRRKPDRQLSLLLAAALFPLYPVSSAEVPEYLESWIKVNKDKLAEVFKAKASPPAAPILCQPESFLIYERLENDRARLRAAWPEELPIEWLEEAAAVWGVRLRTASEGAEGS